MKDANYNYTKQNLIRNYTKRGIYRYTYIPIGDGQRPAEHFPVPRAPDSEGVLLSPELVVHHDWTLPVWIVGPVEKTVVKLVEIAARNARIRHISQIRNNAGMLFLCVQLVSAHLNLNSVSESSLRSLHLSTGSMAQSSVTS